MNWMEDTENFVTYRLQPCEKGLRRAVNECPLIHCCQLLQILRGGDANESTFYAHTSPVDVRTAVEGAAKEYDRMVVEFSTLFLCSTECRSPVRAIPGSAVRGFLMSSKHCLKTGFHRTLFGMLNARVCVHAKNKLCSSATDSSQL